MLEIKITIRPNFPTPLRNKPRLPHWGKILILQMIGKEVNNLF